MPLTRKRRDDESRESDAPSEEQTYTTFVHRARWFAVSQTYGSELGPVTIPEWDAERALKTLCIERITFDKTDGNCQGFARGSQIAINPVAQLPHKTLFHEMAHLCCLRSYVVLRGQVVWNEVAAGAGPHITFSLLPAGRRCCSLV